MQNTNKIIKQIIYLLLYIFSSSSLIMSSSTSITNPALLCLPVDTSVPQQQEKNQTDAQQDSTSNPVATEDHPLLKSLLSRRRLLGKIDIRIHKINCLLQPEVESFFWESLNNPSFIKSWMSNHRAVNKQKYNWRLENVARCLCDFDKILKSFFSKVVVADAIIPTAIKSFQSLVCYLTHLLVTISMNQY